MWPVTILGGPLSLLGWWNKITPETHLKRSREAKNKNWEDSYLYSCLDSKPMPKHGLGEPFGLQAGSKLNSLLGMLNNALNFLKFVPLGTREPQWKKKEKQIV